MQKSFSQKGFTLLELLIVIAILAILATATVLVLNPVELLKQARDAQRLTDMNNLNSAISLYVTNVASPSMASSSNAKCVGGGGTETCYSDRNALLGGTCSGRYPLTDAAVTSTSRAVDGGGWLPVDFTSVAGGSPLNALPTDPSNTATLYYAYACKSTNSTYVLTSAFESAKYTAVTGPAGVDGGSSTAVYEIGTNPGLNSATGGM